MTHDLPTMTRAHFSHAAIRDHWTEQAERHGQSCAASWSDRPAIELEIGKIAGYLADGDQVLDIGCGNGFSTLALATRKRIAIRGVDYVPEMIRLAEVRLAEVADQLSSNVSFGVGELTELQEPSRQYDKTIVTRVIINLGTWEKQAAGLKQAARVVKPGGLLLLSEATRQGWQQLNDFRNEWGLADIPMPPFNLYLDEQQVCETLHGEMQLLEICNFASTYFVGTRVLKPLLAKLLEREHVVPDPNMHWNRWFAALPAAGDYGTQKLFVFRKR
jgi:SAM-dependent methyltransferase